MNLKIKITPYLLISIKEELENNKKLNPSIYSFLTNILTTAKKTSTKKLEALDSILETFSVSSTNLYKYIETEDFYEFKK